MVAAMVLLAFVAAPVVGQADPPACLNFESANDAFSLLGVLSGTPGCGAFSRLFFFPTARNGSGSHAARHSPHPLSAMPPAFGVVRAPRIHVVLACRIAVLVGSDIDHGR